MNRAALSMLVCAWTASLVACFDLFHTFGGANASCEGGTCSPGGADGGGDGGSPPAEPLCLEDPAEALRRAQRACALLGSCAGPIGGNRFAQCMPRALSAYDCRAAPGVTPAGDARRFWDALRRAQTCAQVQEAIAPGEVNKCPAKAPATFSGCVKYPETAGGPGVVRAECPSAGAQPRLETCAASGQRCSDVVVGSNGGRCSGAQGGECTDGGCFNTELRLCPDGGGLDRGRDCRSSGAGACVELVAGHPACKPSGAVPCIPSIAVTCAANEAVGCPAGVEERVRCGSLYPGSLCVPRALRPGETVAEACLAQEDTDGGTVQEDGDRCEEARGSLVSVARGTAYRLRCSDVELGPCVTTVDVVGRSMASCTAR